MYEKLQRILSGLERLTRSLDPPRLRAADAARLLELFSRIQRLAQGACTLLAARAAEAAPHQAEGLSSPAEWLAKTTGTRVGRALRTLKTSEHLKALPATQQAVQAGELSETQASLVAEAAQANPGKEDHLLAVARSQPVKTLERESAHVRAAAVQDDAAWRRQLHQSRRLRHWRAPDGAVCLDARLAPDAGGHVIAALDAVGKHHLARARHAGQSLTREQAAADALVDLTTASSPIPGPPADPSPRPPARPSRSQPPTAGSQPTNGSQPTSGSQPTGPAAPIPPAAPWVGTGPRATVHVRVDLGAIKRGHAADGEICEIIGFGPLPVAAVRDLVGDSILRIILTDSGRIRHATQASRNISTRVRAAVWERDGGRCVNPLCGRTWGLHIHHWSIFRVNGGPSELWNLALTCIACHHSIHDDGFRLSGGPGKWQWHPPDIQPPRKPGPARGRSSRSSRTADCTPAYSFAPVLANGFGPANGKPSRGPDPTSGARGQPP